jgi:osmotically-inducible protein OsmY
MRRLWQGAALGGALAYFFDPQSGAGRRNMVRDRIIAFLRRSGRKVSRAGRGVAAEAYGVSQKVQHRHEEPKDFDDATLAAKVETELFRPDDVPKGQINVNVENGVVVLRGEVDSWEMVDDLVKKAREVQGVRDVENLLHLPGQPAPTHH